MDISREGVVGLQESTIRQVPQLETKLVTFSGSGQHLAVTGNSHSANNALAGIDGAKKLSVHHVPNNHTTKVFTSCE